MTKQEIRERQENRCFYCHEPLQDDGDNPATLDHVIPHSLVKVIGGAPDNRVYACFKCNQKKADKIPEDWDGRVGDWQLTEFGWVWDGRVDDWQLTKFGWVWRGTEKIVEPLIKEKYIKHSYRNT